MASLRWRTAILLAWLMLFFNIERLDLGSNDTINIASGVYVVAMIVAVAGITPMFKRRSLPLLVGLAAALFLVVMIIDPQRQLVGGIHTYITFTSLFLLSVTLVLRIVLGKPLKNSPKPLKKSPFPTKVSICAQ